MSSKLGFGDYLKAAFHRHVRVPLLGSLPANYMALGIFAVAGIANPGFWFLGAALELAYLFAVAGNRRFQKLVDGERLLAEQQTYERGLHATIEALWPENQARYRRLLGQCRTVLGISESLEADSLGSLRDVKAKSLNQILGLYLRLLTSRQLITGTVNTVDARALEAEIGDLEARLETAAGNEALHRSLAGTLDIKRQRLDNLKRAHESLTVVDAELERIAQQVDLLREQSAVSGRPELISASLDSVTSTMAQTSRWMDEHADLLAPDPGVSTPSSLPRLESEGQ